MMQESSYDQAALRRLASAVMDGIATEADCRELTAMLRNDAAARDEYLAFVDLHANLAGSTAESSTLRSEKPTSASRIASSNSATTLATPTRSQSRWRFAFAVAVAASLLMGAFWLSSQSSSSVTSFASVAQLTDAQWQPGDEITVGDRVGQQLIRIEDGFVRLEFDSGVELTLQGPAEIELLSAVKAKMNEGLLTANVPKGAEGFAVVTPTAEVVDLGTSFGIDLREANLANVSVFDGEVEVTVSDASEKHLLSEGNSVRIGEDRRIEKVAIDPERYAKVWPISSGIVGSTDVFRVLPPWPKQIHFIASDDHIFVAHECRAVELASELKVDISEPGEYSLVEHLTPQELKVGRAVGSYILHFHPANPRLAHLAQRVSGSITFDRPILGLILQHEQLVASSRRFNLHGVGEVHRPRAVDFTGEFDGDTVSISEDRRTLTVDLICPGPSSDLIRVIVDREASN